MRKSRLKLKTVVLIFIVVLSGPYHSNASVFWTDDFENHIYPNWTYAGDGRCSSAANPDGTGCNPGLSTDVAHSGKYSLKGVYTGPNSGSYMDRSFPGTSDFWERVWVYFRNFSAIQCPNSGCAGTKNIFNFGTVSFSNWWMFSYNGDQKYYVEVQTPAFLPNDTSVKNQNSQSVSLGTGKWTCLEWHTKVNSPGQANGVIEMWVDGVNTMSYTNLNLSANGGVLHTTRHYVQHGMGTIYWDDHAVGNTRVGCGGSVQPAPAGAGTTPPPATPTGLIIQ